MSTTDDTRLLRLRERELTEARAELCGQAYLDWYAENRIAHLERMVADIRARLKGKG